MAMVKGNRDEKKRANLNWCSVKKTSNYSSRQWKCMKRKRNGAHALSKENEQRAQNGKINFNAIVLSYQNANVCHHHVIWLAFAHCVRSWFFASNLQTNVCVCVCIQNIFANNNTRNFAWRAWQSGVPAPPPQRQNCVGVTFLFKL